MNSTIIISFYFLAVNMLAALVFLSDKYKAGRNKKRISEKTLHSMELIGGVFAVIPCMYLFRHKNRKASYFLVSYFILALWIALLVFLQNQLSILND